ncbi:MAG: hypothetical protein GY907_00680 [Bacteroidetes bacterium]|nr:hypothetical protein [Candidatus Brocadiaceae bacterium]MCP4909191.1 hypothetical protein [Bacteroidota bacterium]
MTPAQEAKEAGFKSLKELSEYLKTPVTTLQSWHKTKHRFFRVVLKGAAIDRLNSLDN